MNILITGGGSGLGEAITRLLCSNKENKIYFTYCKSKENAIKIEKEFNNAFAIECDFSKQESINNLLKQIDDYNIDVLINNAIVSLAIKHFHKFTTTEIIDSFHVNIIPVIKITSHLIQHFRKNKNGIVVTILSDILYKSSIGWSIYKAEKGYLDSIIDVIAMENEKSGIIFHRIYPSMMNTSLTNVIDERVKENIALNRPNGKLLSIEEVSEEVKKLIEKQITN